jgi:transcription-repair coupling factor (superfamily II helicase)
VEAGESLSIASVPAGAVSFCLALLRKTFPGRPIVAITPSLKQQEILHADTGFWLNLLETGTPKALFFPSWEILPHENKLPHADIISERLDTTLRLAKLTGESQAPTIITTGIALTQRTFRPEVLRERTRTLRRGETVNPLDLIEWLEAQGYEPEAQVSHRGELSWRGGIVDVWPMSAPWPVRLEFFGDELESLREFDPHLQRSRDTIESAVLPPAGELGLFRAMLAKANAETTEPANVAGLGTLLDYLTAESLFVLVEPSALESAATAYEAQIPAQDPYHSRWTEIVAESKARGLATIVLTEAPADTLPEEESARVFSGWDFESLETFRPLGATMSAPVVAEGQRRDFFQQMHRWLRQGYNLDVVCANTGEAQRFAELWNDYQLESRFTIGAEGTLPTPEQSDSGQRGHPAISLGTLSRGFLAPWIKSAVVTDAEIFGRYKVQRPRRLKSPHAQSMRSAFEVDFTDFEEGDYVVHLQNGIGIYRGLQTISTASQRTTTATGQECLVIEYAPGNPGEEPPRLYVPVTEAHLVSKYVGAGKARPQLHTLGGTRWTKAKEQAQRAVRDLASDLLSVQATREIKQGHPFSADNNWQREFEASFEYEETQDQLRAIDAVKRDMEQPKPMDRLLCGDVGFGKTEVAIRAAFKAVMGGKQVALLVPTTVLAQQHYNNFRERMAEYPVRVEVLSRFRTARQQRTVLEQAAAGAVDIVIGTHRIVQGDVQFKDLGLVIVDEEQRFGVKHKERFKFLRETVDVLTLSATPIPRTLYLALTGARDLSTLETPPQDRLPVETIVCNYDERVIRDAVQRELNRGGQVYFLHNRVSTINTVATKLQALVPTARIAIGHGQMDDDDLDKVMTKFVNGETDVLVSTTIIESGLDIPNANTIIIDRADRFGLSELYQLRGRVGRYKHQAYAYLLLPRHAQLLTEARKRMSAIRQYSALGSGFKIAMRDLEIRGAGNILGAQQSGHITAVGFDLYCQLLAQSVRSLKGEKTPQQVDVRLRLDFLASHAGELRAEAAAAKGPPKHTPVFDIAVPRDEDITIRYDTEESKARKKAADTGPTRKEPAYIPLEYVREPAQRIELYRKLMQAVTKGELDNLRADMRDRFGPLPASVELMLEVADLRFVAAQRKVTSLEVVEGKIKITRNGDLITIGGQFPRLTKKEAKARLNEIRKLLLSIG